MSLLPSDNEWKLQLDFIDEACSLYGVRARIFDIKDVTLYQDNPTVSSNFRCVNILFQEYVSKRLLANLEWQNTEVGQEGMVVFIPRNYGGSLVEISRDKIVEVNGVDLYRIMDISKSYIIGLWYIVKLVPYVKEPPRIEDGSKSSYFRPHREEVE